MKRFSLLAFLIAGFASLGWAQCNPTSCVVANFPSPPDGFTGSAYGVSGNGYQFTATGGTPLSGGLYTWNVSSGAVPPGLSLSQSGLLSGNPTTPGTFQFGVTARDSAGGTSSNTPFTVNVFTGTGGGGQLQFTNPPSGSSVVNNATLGSSYFFQFQAVGGSGVYTYTGFIPVSGLSLNSAGQITGVPSGGVGTFGFQVTVSDSQNSGIFTTGNFTITVSNFGGGGFQITTTSLPNGTANVGYQTTQLFANGSGSYQWGITQGQIPPGLQFSTSGQLFGTPTTNGTYTFTVSVQDFNTSQTTSRQFTVQIGNGAGGLQITTTFLPSGTPGVTYQTTQLQANGSGSYQWTVSSGQLPLGLTLSTLGQLGGVPTTAGNYSFTITVFDQNSQLQASRQFSVQIGTSGGFQVQNTSVPNGTPGVFFQTQFFAINGTGNYQWSVNQGQVPPGLNLSSSGVLSGTPTNFGGYTFTVQVLDTQTEQTATRQFTMQITTTGGTGGVSITTSTVPNASAGVFYSFQFQATGCNPCSWTLGSGSGSVPPGLFFGNNGILSGTPTVQGVFSFIVQVFNSSTFSNFSGSDQRSFSITVTSGQLNLIERTLPFGIQGQPYSTTVHGSGGGPPYFYSLGSTDVTGLTIDSSGGTISGTPTNSGNFVLPVTVSDATGNSFTYRFTLFIATPVSILTTSLPSSTVGGPVYDQTLQAGGGQGPYIWSISTGTLPPGITLDRNSGHLGGSPTANGKFSFTVQVVDSGNRTATKDLSILIGTPLSITTTSLADGAVGVQYSQTLASDGGQTPVTWAKSADSTLPAGLTLSAQGVLSGSPTAAGSFSFTVVATDAVNSTVQKTFSINVVNPITITTNTAVDGQRGVAYQQGLGANGGTPSYNWSISSGSLPPGLILNSLTGVISGTPTAAGSFNFTVQVKDSQGQTASHSYTVSIIETLSISANDATGSLGAAFSQTVSATGGTGPYSFTAAGLPAGLSLNSSNGAVTGTPTGSGTSSVTYTVTDASRGSVSKTVTITIQAPPTITIAPALPSTTPPARQTAVTASLATAYGTDINGTLTVSFTPAGSHQDTSVRFSNGATQVSFSVPQGQTAATFQNAPGLTLLTGTTAGTIVLTTTLSAGGVNLPAPAVRRIAVDPGPPVLTAAQDRSLPLLQQGNGTVTVNFDGYSLTGELVSCKFVFSASSGNTLQTSEFTVPMTAPFATWMGNSASQSTGTNFFASVPFTITNGAATSIVGVTVTCTNVSGTSNALTP